MDFKPKNLRYDPPELSQKIKDSLTEAQKRVLAIYEKAPGNLSYVAIIAGVPRRTIYNWLRDDDNFKRAFDSKVEYLYYFAKSKLLVAVDRNEKGAAIFFLKTFGKRHGFY